MKQSIKAELIEHVQNLIEDGTLNEDNHEDWHHVAFNEDYYIIGYYNAEQWLKKHDVSAFEAMETVIEWERDVLGEVSLTPEDMNAERIVNLYVYVLGEQIIFDEYTRA